MGIVYNGTYLRYFEIGRTELLRSIGLPYVGLEADGYLLPVLEAHVEYKNPARYDDLIDIVTSYKPDLSTVITLAYEVQLNGGTLAQGYTRHTFVNSQTFRPVRPPKQFREAIEKALKEIVA
jgi:acyl-CoA thioester hydrolase